MQVLFFLRSNGALGRFGRHLASRPVVRDLHNPFTIERESVVARRRNVRAKDGETLRCKEIGPRRFQVENRLAGGAKKLFRERQQIRRPRADGHYNTIALDALSVVEDDSLNAVIVFVQMSETAAAS